MTILNELHMEYQDYIISKSKNAYMDLHKTFKDLEKMLLSAYLENIKKGLDKKIDDVLTREKINPPFIKKEISVTDAVMEWIQALVKIKVFNLINN